MSRTAELKAKWSAKEGAANSTCSPEAHEIYALAEELEMELAESTKATDASNHELVMKYGDALEHILWVRDCGIDGRNEDGEWCNFTEQERDTMYAIAAEALGVPLDPKARIDYDLAKKE